MVTKKIIKLIELSIIMILLISFLTCGNNNTNINIAENNINIDSGDYIKFTGDYNEQNQYLVNRVILQYHPFMTVSNIDYDTGFCRANKYDYEEGILTVAQFYILPSTTIIDESNNTKDIHNISIGSNIKFMLDIDNDSKIIASKIMIQDTITQSYEGKVLLINYDSNNCTLTITLNDDSYITFYFQSDTMIIKDEFNNQLALNNIDTGETIEIIGDTII